MIFRQNKLLTIIVALGVLGSAWALANRHAVEMQNRAVEITVDYSEVAGLAGASGLTMAETLSRLKGAGITTVAVQERTIADLVAQGLVRLEREQWPKETTRVRALTTDAAAALRESDLPFMDWKAPSALGSSEATVRAEPEYILTRPLGLPEDQISTAKEAGMSVIARLVNYPRVRKSDVERTARQLERYDIHTVIFASDQVLGFRGAIDDVADVFKEHGLVYGSVEFAKQKGDQRLSEKMMPNVVRVHSVSSTEMATLAPGSAVERFARAAKERNIRVAYVRLVDLADDDPLKTNTRYVSAVATGLRSEGFALGSAHPFEDPAVPVAARVMISLGVAAGVMLLVLSIARLSPTLVWIGFAALAVVFAGLVALGIAIGLKLTALDAAIAFPTLAVLYAASNTPAEPLSGTLRTYFWVAAARFAGALILSAAGGLMVAGLLGRQEFMLRIDQFSGVKLAHVAPILLVTAAFAMAVGWGTASWSEQKERALTNLRRLGGQPVLIWQTVIGLVLLVMLAMLLARSGNEPGVGVSPLELRFRALLDTLLFVRPRTKEFLVGHPAMLLGIAAALGGRRNWAALLLVIGMFGEVSLVNTFCHIHTPLVISVMRSVIGGVLGFVIGAIVLLLYSRLKKDACSGKLSEMTGRERVGVEK